MIPAFDVFGRFGAYEFIEVTALASGGLFLVEQGEIAFVEFLEKLVPGDLLQIFFAAKTWKSSRSMPMSPRSPVPFTHDGWAPRSSAQRRISS